MLPTGLAERYERLRACVLAHDTSSGSRLGAGVVTARGLAAWMQVAEDLATDVAPVPSAVRPGPPLTLLPSMRQDLIQLLGGAVLTLMERGAL